MKTFLKILSVLIIIIATFGILLDATIAVLAWTYNTPVTEALLEPLTTAQAANQRLTVVVDEVQTITGDVGNAVAPITQQVEQIQTYVETGKPVIDLVENLSGKPVEDSLGKIYTTLVGLSESASALNSSIQIMDAMPFVDVPKMAKGAQELEDLLNGLVQGIDDFRDQFAAMKQEAGQRFVQPVIDTLSKIEKAVFGIQAKLVEVRDQLISIDQKLTNLIEALPGIIDWISVAITIVMLWLILAQAALFYLALVYFKTGQLTFKPAAALSQPA